MIDEMESLNQVDLLYSNIAKELYNLTLYTIGDQLSAEKITINAFSDAFQAVADKSNVNMFRLHCVKKIYCYCKRLHKTVIYDTHNPMHEYEDDPKVMKRQKLLELLSMLNFNNRFLLLLFCQQKYQVKHVSKITNRPAFLIRKRFYRVLKLVSVVCTEIEVNIFFDCAI